MRNLQTKSAAAKVNGTVRVWRIGYAQKEVEMWILLHSTSERLGWC